MQAVFLTIFDKMLTLQQASTACDMHMPFVLTAMQQVGAILVIIRDRHLSCPCENLKQDVGSGIPPADKMAEVLKVLWPDKLKQFDLHADA